MIKIAVTGPESSGKTTLTRDLAKALKACFTEEYAREYLEKKKGAYTMDDLLAIAEEQYRRNRGTGCKKDFLVCDTEMTVIKIWAMDKFGYCPGSINTLTERQEFDFIFLCKPDIPWQPDPLREDPGRRDYLFRLYAEELFLQDVDFVVLEGSREQRLEKALREMGLAK